MIEPTDYHAFVDGELNSNERVNVQLDVANSPQGQREVEAISNLKALLLHKALKPKSEQAWTLCVKRLDELDKAKRVETIVGRFAPALCGVFFLAIVVGGMLSRHQGARPNWSPLTPPNESGWITKKTHPKSQADVAKIHWLDQLIKQSKVSTPDKLVILHVYKGVMEGELWSRVVARDSKGDIDILVVPNHIQFEGLNSMAGHPGYFVGRLGRANCITRRDDTFSIVVTANRAYDELADVMSYIKIK